MDDFSATQLCESSKLSQIQNLDGDKKKQIGTLKIRNREYPIYIGRNTIGRLDSNQIIIKDASVSKHHAEIEGGKRSCYVTDLKSSNGTFDQFKEKYQENKTYLITNGSTIQFGAIETTFTHFRYYRNVVRTPTRSRINQIVTSTPKSIVNSTFDDSLMVYGTHDVPAISNPCSSKFVGPKNLHSEFSKTEEKEKSPTRRSVRINDIIEENQIINSSNSPKVDVANSSSSITEDSPAATENLKVPQNPRSRRTKRTNSPKNLIKDSTNASKETVVNPRISRRGKIPTASPSTPLTPNQALNQENLSAQAISDLNSLSASTSSRAKRSKQNSPLKHKVLFTGIPVNIYQKQLAKLGLNQTDDVKECTILVTDKVRRTFKFLCSVSRGIPILSVKWIADSAEKSNIQDLKDYVIRDRIAERKFNFNLKESLQKARDRKMLEGYTVILTPNITAPPVAELKEMVMASGGKVVLRPPTKWKKDTIIISNDEDRENANKFMAKAPNTVSLHSTEFLLTGILKQEVDLESYLLKFT